MGCERTTEKIIRDLNCKSAIETENGKTMDEELSEEELCILIKCFYTIAGGKSLCSMPYLALP